LALPKEEGRDDETEDEDRGVAGLHCAAALSFGVSDNMLFWLVFVPVTT